MNQLEMYELMKRNGPMTVNQLVDVVYPDIEKYNRNSAQATVTTKLRQLRKWRMVEGIGWLKASGGRPKERVWAVKE